MNVTFREEIKSHLFQSRIISIGVEITGLHDVEIISFIDVALGKSGDSLLCKFKMRQKACTCASNCNTCGLELRQIFYHTI